MGTLHDGGVGLFIYSLIKGHNHHLPLSAALLISSQEHNQGLTPVNLSAFYVIQAQAIPSNLITHGINS